MKRKVFNFSLMASIGLLAFGVSALSGCSPAAEITAASVSLNKTNLSLAVGESYQLKAAVSKGYGSTVRWFTSNENVVRVNGGHVFACGPGTATVTASIGGGYADCLVTVEGEGEVQTGNTLSINPTSKTIGLGNTFTINYSAKAEDGSKVTVTFSSSDSTIASVTSAGVVTGAAVGNAVISVVASNGLSKNCAVTVKDDGGDGDYDIGVDKNLGKAGEMTIGSPLLQRQFMMDRLAEFNQLTGSSVRFTVTTFEEDNGTSGYKDATSMPAVFPYASDQTLALFQFNALSSVGKTDANWIRSKMGDAAYNAAKYSSLVGYPFSSDNGVVMYYNAGLMSRLGKTAEQVENITIDELFELAGDDYEINFPIGTGFYAAGALMTYAKGETLYKLTPTATSYNVAASFNSDAGIASARVVRDIANKDAIRNAAAAPVNDVLATITDASKVQDFKAALGADYAVAPLPFVDKDKTVRLGSFLGYKFYGVNNTISPTDKETASAVAKFLSSEYVQAKRFEEYQVRPTQLSLAELASNEPHVKALSIQQEAKATIPLTAISSELWSAAATAEGSIKVLAADASDPQYRTILDTLDKACQANN